MHSPSGKVAYLRPVCESQNRRHGHHQADTAPLHMPAWPASLVLALRSRTSKSQNCLLGRSARFPAHG